MLGLDPAVESENFRIVSFPMKAGGIPDFSGIEFEPEQAKWNVSGANAVLKGARSLEGEWGDVSDMAENEQAEMRFFRFDVVLPAE